MIHRHDNLSNRLFERKKIALSALVIVCAFVLLYNPARSAFTEAVFSVAPGVWSAAAVPSNVWNSFLTNFRAKNTLVAENDALHVDILRMQAQVLDRNLLDEKVRKLEEMLGRAQSDNRVVAYVLVGPKFSPYDTLVVDAGLDEGVAVGNTVVYAGSGAIGEVVEVSAASSKVKLYSSPGEEHFVLVGPHYIPVTAFGRGMGNFEAKVSQDSVVATGDNIVSVKGDFILGTISLVEEVPAEPIKRIFFRTPFNITEIRSVEIIVNKRP